ncbi:MAG: hypothetical protein ACRDP6_04300 [Actinoallomurus sp.]
MDEFGPLNLRPHPGRRWAERGGKHENPDREPRRRRRVCDNFSPHLTTNKCQRVSEWAAANNVEIAYTPANSFTPGRSARYDGDSGA